MSTPAKPKATKKPSSKASGPKAAESTDLILDSLAQLRAELASLKEDVAVLQTTNSPGEPTLNASEVMAGMVDQIQQNVSIEAESFEEELHKALSSPTMDVEFSDAELEVSEGDDTSDFGTSADSPESLKAQAELASVMEAIELEFPDATTPTGMDHEDEGVMLSDDEIAALVAATSSLAEAAEPQSTDLATAPEAVFEQTVPLQAPEASGGLENLDPDDNADTHIVSAEEIQAMLGIKDLSTDAELQVPSHESDETQAPLSEDASIVDPEIELPVSEPVASEDVNLDEIDPGAVEKVPGILAAESLALPVCVIDDRLHCLSVEPFDHAGLDKISKLTGLTVVPHATSITRVLSEIRSRYGACDDDLLLSLRAEQSPGLWTKLFRRQA